MSSDNMPNYYEVLGIEKTATKEEIKNAYRESAKKYHPDNNAVSNASFFFKMINDAYETLSDEEKRKRYDDDLAAPKTHVPKEPQAAKAAQEKNNSSADKTELDAGWIFERDISRKNSAECTYEKKPKNPFVDALMFCFKIIAKIVMVPITFATFVLGIVTFMLSKATTFVIGFLGLIMMGSLIFMLIEILTKDPKLYFVHQMASFGEVMYIHRIFGTNTVTTALVSWFIAFCILVLAILVSESIPTGIFTLATKMFDFITISKKTHSQHENMTYTISTGTEKKKFSCFSVVSFNGRQYIALTPKVTPKSKGTTNIIASELLLFRFKLDEHQDISLTNVESDDEFNGAFKKLIEKTA